MKYKKVKAMLALTLAIAMLSSCGAGNSAGVPSDNSSSASVSSVQEGAGLELTTVTVNGVEVPADQTSEYEGTPVETHTEPLGKISSLSFFDNFPYRTALYIKDGACDDSRSVVEAIGDGVYTDTELSDARIQAMSPSFSGVIVDGSEYTVSNSEILMPTESDGSWVNDFSGLGAAVMNTNNGILTIENTNIDTAGVGKLALITDNGANTIVKNSSLNADGGTLYEGYYSNADQLMMVAPPWVLGLDDSVANARTTNLMGDYSTQTFVDSQVTANGWGALSTDSDANYSTNQHLIAINTDVNVEHSGYGSYVVTEGVMDYYGVDMDVATYGVIMTDGLATFQSYTGGQEVDVIQYGPQSEWDPNYTFTDPDYPEEGGGIPVVSDGTIIATVASEQVAEGQVVPSVITSDNFAFMCHSNYSQAWNVVKLLDGTQVHSGDAAFLVKKVNADLFVDHATVESDSGVLLQIIDNDDDYVGPNMGLNWGLDIPELARTVGSTNIEDLFAGNPCHFPTFNERLVEPAGWSYEWTETDMGVTAASLNTTGDSGWTVNFTATSAELTGDIWNSSGYVTGNGGSKLQVTLGENCTLSGLISAGAFKHTIQQDESLFVADETISTGGYYEALVGNDYAGRFGGAADWSNANLLGHVENTQYTNGYNAVSVVLRDNAVWTVSGTCLLNSLEIGAEAQVNCVEGRLTMTVNGVETELTPGTQYQGEIILSVA